jgi:hypothetical protein
MKLLLFLDEKSEKKRKEKESRIKEGENIFYY